MDLVEKTVKHRSLLLCLFLVALTAAVYLPTVDHQWLGYDDTWLISSNRILKDFSLSSVQKVLFDLSYETRRFLGYEYLPVRDLVAMVGLRIWGTHVAGFLLLNLSLYLAAIALFYALLMRLYRNHWVAFFAAWFFALHPVHVESVAWAAALKDVLALLFFMAALLNFEIFLAEERRRHLIASVLCFALAVLSKYLAIVLFGYVFMRLLGRVIVAANWRRCLPLAVRWLLPFALVTLLCLGLSVFVGKQVDFFVEPISSNPFVIFVTEIEIVAQYLGNILLPLWLSPDYGFKLVTSIFDLRGVFIVIFCLSLMAASGLLLWRATRRGVTREGLWIALFWIAWFFIALLPVSQIVPIKHKMADRYLLLPLMSPAILFAYGSFLLSRRLPKRIVLVGSIIICLSLTLLTFRQVGFWRDSETLSEQAILVEPEAPVALSMLAKVRRQQGRLADERLLLTRAVAANNKLFPALMHLGNTLSEKDGELDRANRLYERVLSLKSDHVMALNNQGALWLQQGEVDKAIINFEKVLKINPNMCPAMRNLARAYYLTLQHEKTIEWLQLASLCVPGEEFGTY